MKLQVLNPETGERLLKLNRMLKEHQGILAKKPHAWLSKHLIQSLTDEINSLTNTNQDEQLQQFTTEE